jgi:hypothetical protein
MDENAKAINIVQHLLFFKVIDTTGQKHLFPRRYFMTAA